MVETPRRWLRNGEHQIPDCCVCHYSLTESEHSQLSQITFASHIRTKAVWLELEGHNWGIIHCFISAWDGTITVYSNVAMHPCTLLASFKGFLWKNKKNKKKPPSSPTSTTNYHTKVSQHTTLHYTESPHRQSITGWLKLSSLEFPQFASVIKVDEGSWLARRAQKWSAAYSSLCSLHGEDLLWLCLVPLTL